MADAEIIELQGRELAPYAAPARAMLPQGLMPQSIDDAVTLASAFFKAGMFGVRSPEQALTVLLTGMELGLSSAQSMRAIHVINNKPTLSADVMIALCKRQNDVCKYIQLVSSDNTQATYKTHRYGDPEPVTMTFAMEDAKRANLLGNPTWTKFPSNMLRARCASNLCRAVYPDIILGLYTEEEAAAIRLTPESQQSASEAQFLESPVSEFPSQRQKASETYREDNDDFERGYEESRDFGGTTSRDGTPKAERTPPQERSPATTHPQTQATAGGIVLACTGEGGCGRALTKAQAELSNRNYGQSYCPACQRSHSRTPAMAA